MIRNLKALVLAMAALFVLSAAIASAASAQQGTLTSDGPVTLTGEETGPSGSNATTMFGLSIQCPGTTYTGHKYNETPHQFIPSGATTITLTPHYKNCVAGNFPVTIDMNGCDYVVHLGITTGGIADTYGVSFDIVCPVGQEITKTIFTNAADHAANKPFCILHIKSQAGLVGAHATDTTNGHIDISGVVEGVHIVRTKSASHLILCPEGTTATAKMDIDITLKGHNSLGSPTAVSLSHP